MHRHRIRIAGRDGKDRPSIGSDSHMAGFGPRLIPDRLRPANQATLTRGVRLSLAERWAWACRRLWVRGAQTLSKHPDVSRARKVRTPWPPARPQRWPLLLSRGQTIIVFAASTAPLPMGHPHRGPPDNASAGGGCGQTQWRCCLLNAQPAP